MALYLPRTCSGTDEGTCMVYLDNATGFQYADSPSDSAHADTVCLAELIMRRELSLFIEIASLDALA